MTQPNGPPRFERMHDGEGPVPIAGKGPRPSEKALERRVAVRKWPPALKGRDRLRVLALAGERQSEYPVGREKRRFDRNGGVRVIDRLVEAT